MDVERLLGDSRDAAASATRAASAVWSSRLCSLVGRKEREMGCLRKAPAVHTAARIGDRG